MTNSKRTRRFFRDDLKKEIVYKIESGQTTKQEVLSLYKISNLLLDRWIKAFSGKTLVPYYTPSVSHDVSDDIVVKLKLRLLDEIMAKESLQQRMASLTPSIKELAAVTIKEQVSA